MTKPPLHRWGPRGEGNGTSIQIWAPDQREVGLEIGDAAPCKMRPAQNGWFEAACAAPPGTAYRFRVENASVPDPASRRQSGDVHGQSVVVDPAGYCWRSTSWRGRPWEEVVLYELHPGLMGGFSGVARHLRALAEIGVTAIELMPIGDFPGARNWGYDGVLPFAPDETYGSPDELKNLIDEAHGLGLMVFLDVVYNHFGPDGNFLSLYAREFFSADEKTPWGDGIDFRRPAVRRFFIENALYWIQEFKIDGLRLDAVHAIRDHGWLNELAYEVHANTPGRHVHLVVENENNDTGLLERGFRAQWNDDIHHVLHVLLTGETGGYYRDFAQDPIGKLARALKEGFIYQGDYSPHQGKRRGTASAHLPPTSFIAFLQNHDHIGNRALGERLTVLIRPEALRAAVALLLLSPQIPLIFMGEEVGAREPFLYFCDHRDANLAKAVREGRRSEFAHFPEFADESMRERIPDPNAVDTYERSRVNFDSPDAGVWRDFYKTLLTIRHEHLVPRLKGAHAEYARVIGEKAVMASWRMGDGANFTLASNFDSDAVNAHWPKASPLWGSLMDGALAAHSTVCWIETP